MKRSHLFNKRFHLFSQSFTIRFINVRSVRLPIFPVSSDVHLWFIQNFRLKDAKSRDTRRSNENQIFPNRSNENQIFPDRTNENQISPDSSRDLGPRIYSNTAIRTQSRLEHASFASLLSDNVALDSLERLVVVITKRKVKRCNV